MRVSLEGVVGLTFSILLFAAVLLNSSGCAGKVQAADLMDGISAQAVQGKPIDARFIENTADFSLELFRATIDAAENSLVSPLSVLLALGMTANGAATETLAQMEAVLGNSIPLAELNAYLYTYVEGLPSREKVNLNIANSIWFRENLAVEKDFLQTNADYYGAAAYKSAFDQQTIQDVNNWVEENTRGMIDKILEEIAPDAIMYLINAIAFEGNGKNNTPRKAFSRMSSMPRMAADKWWTSCAPLNPSTWMTDGPRALLSPMPTATIALSPCSPRKA